ncbi:MAG TPA: HAD hydrolase family protein [Polyangiaceae bacterium]|nr:HAD hydrolase family protein [Polyangiaceae bacterium]
MMPAPRFLLAVDMDGTLLRDDKTIAPEDAAAIRSAPAHGIAVTIATGRLTTGALPVARDLGLSTPLVCADGAVLVDPLLGTLLERRAILAERASHAVESIMSHGLVPYVFLADSIHCEASGEQHRRVVETWTPNLFVHGSLAAAVAWREPESVAMTLGIGTEEWVLRASAHLQGAHVGELDTVHFSLFGTPVWAVRSLPGGCDKGQMLERLAQQLGLPRARVAAVGDWLNDVGMFQFAGRSFAMGHAPPVVRSAATDVLRSTSRAGGGIAEAIAALIATP